LTFKSAAVLGLVLAGAARSAQADSDGYYCTGPNYIAYEFAAPVHALYIVVLRDSLGLDRPTRVPLPDFQVHGMRCSAGSVELLGWDSLYTATLTGAKTSLVARIAPWAHQGTSRQALQEYGALNLGGWSTAVRVGRADTIPLAIASRRYTFALAIDVQPLPRECAYKVVTRLVQRDSSSRPVATLTLFDGKGTMECGE